MRASCRTLPLDWSARFPIYLLEPPCLHIRIVKDCTRVSKYTPKHHRLARGALTGIRPYARLVCRTLPTDSVSGTPLTHVGHVRTLDQPPHACPALRVRRAVCHPWITPLP